MNLNVFLMNVKQCRNNLLVVILLPLCLMITGCRFNSTYSNREKDRHEGEKVVSEFYELLKKEDYKGTYTFFDSRFFNVTDTQKLNEIFSASFEKLGAIKNYRVERWETEAVIGTDAKTNYRFLCDIKRSDYSSKEIITLIKEKEGIKILGYQVNSDGFFKK